MKDAGGRSVTKKQKDAADRHKKKTKKKKKQAPKSKPKAKKKKAEAPKWMSKVQQLQKILQVIDSQ